MNWLALEAFASLSETLSFTKTAAKLGVTQPNVSKLISNLEAELEVSLFSRNRKHVALTVAGTELREAFVARHRDLKDALTQFKSGQKGLAGRVRIGCLPELGINLVFPHLLAFKKAHEQLELEVVYCSEAQIMDGLAKGAFDFGICARGETSDLLRAYPLLVENILLLGTPKMIRQLSDGHWERAPWVDPLADDFLAAGFIRANRKKLPFKEIEPKLVANSHRSMVQALLAEVGFAVLPEASAAGEIKSGKLVAFPGLQRRDQIYLLQLDLERTPDRIKATREHLLKLKGEGKGE
jgi:DNA-binding transcriptional LysR family regulator